MIEPCVGIVAACLPTLRPLFKELWPGGPSAQRATTPAPGPVKHRSRVPETKSRWLRLTTRDARDVEAEEAEAKEHGSAAAACRNGTLWSTRVERGDGVESPPPKGINIRTAIEIASTSCESLGSETWVSYGLDAQRVPGDKAHYAGPFRVLVPKQ